MTNEEKRKEASELDPEALQKGRRLYLKAADGRTDSDDWVQVRSRWSDPVRFTLDDTQRRGRQEVAKSGTMSFETRGGLIREVHAAMIAGWGGSKAWAALDGKTFDEAEPTDENKLAWLKANPQHGEAIDDACSSDDFFL